MVIIPKILFKKLSPHALPLLCYFPTLRCCQMYRPLSAFAVRILTPIMLPPLYNGVNVWIHELAILSPCACNVLRHVCDVLYIYRYTCVCIYIHITKIEYYTYIILHYCTYSWLFTLPSLYYLSVIYVIYQIISTISLQIFKFKSHSFHLSCQLFHPDI